MSDWKTLVPSVRDSMESGRPLVPREARIERVALGDRWLVDAFEGFPVPGGLLLLQVDMTQAQRALRILRNAKIPATYVHLLVRAVALAHSICPDAIKVLCDYRRLSPGPLDVGVSMAGKTAYAPVVVVRAADGLHLSELVPTFIAAVDGVAEREAADLAAIRRWIVPFRWLRLWILRSLHRNLKWRVRLVGHVQITCLPNVDVAVPLVFYSSWIFGFGAIRDRVIAVHGQPVVRPTLWLSGVADHAASDGMTGGDFMDLVKGVLEGGLLVEEAREAVARKAAQVEVRGGGEVRDK